MHLNCPHCRSPIEVVDPESVEELVCPSCGSSFRLDADRTAQEPTTAVLKKLGRFTLVNKLGQGAFGAVYKARDPQLDRTVAVKIPRAGNLPDGHDKQRFLREARSVAQLRHPGIVSVYEAGEADDTPFIVSDFVDGVTLADYLTARKLTFKEAAELIAQLAEALDYAHRMGVVHRDVKPSNVMLEAFGCQSSVDCGQEAPSQRTTDKGPLTTRLMDFGLAKRDAGEITITIDGQVLGTPAYMSPEQAKGDAHKVDGRSDIYSLGVILYELLTGELPFRGNTRMLLHQVLHDEPRSPRTLNDRIPRDLETICLKAMSKDAARRYPTARALADDLRRWQNGETITARPVGQTERLLRWCRRNPTVAGLTGAVAAALLLGAVVSLALALHAIQKADDEREARLAADREKQKARESEEKANASAEQASRNEDLANKRAEETLAAVEQFQIANGLREADAGQLFQALRWFALPLSGEGATKPRAELYRNRLSNYWRLPPDASATRYVLTQSFQHESEVAHAAFSPDGRHVVTASWDNTARVWDAASGQPLTPPLQHQDYVNHAAFSPDGRHVVTASWDNTARVWDAASGQPLTPPLQHQDAVNHAEFSPDGRRVVTASQDMTARVWDVSTDERPAEDWIRVIQFLAGGMDRFGGHASLSPEKLTAEWDYLRGKYAQDFTVTKEQAGAWRIREARTAFAAKDLTAAQFHFDWACRVLPDDPSVPRRCAEVLAGFEECDQADGYFAKAVAHGGPAERQAWIAALYVRFLLKEDVVQRLQSYPDLPAEVRQDLLAGAAVVEEDAGALNAASWELVTSPASTPAEHQRALRFAQAAVLSKPDDGSYLSTLGVALYRVGRYEPALETLTRSVQLNAKGGKPHPADVAFLALCHHQLKQTAQAAARLRELRDLIEHDWSKDAEARAFLEEAAAAIEGKRGSEHPEGR